MADSLFKDFIKPGTFETVSNLYYEEITGSEEDQTYLHDSILTPNYSLTMTFDSITGRFKYVTADIVSFDSPAPVKKRNTISKASGAIPKLATARNLNEKEMNEIIQLSQMQGQTNTMMQKLFADTKYVTVGIKETIEEMLYSSLSSGVMFIQDDTNVGHGARFDYNIPDENKFGGIWSDSDAKPIDDIRRVLDAAEDNQVNLSYLWITKKEIAKLAKNLQVRQHYSFSTSGAVSENIPILSSEKVKSMLLTEFGLEVIEVGRTFTHEKDGVQTTKQGWTENMIVFTERRNVGTLEWSNTAESQMQQEGVMYNKPVDYILVSKSGSTDPVSEKTAAQAIAMPVLQDVDSIYYLDTEEGQVISDSEVEGDANITIFGATYTVVQVKAGLDSINVAYEDGINDAGIITLVNTLSKAKEKALQTYLESL
jgi:hypothetical protein